MNIDKVKIRLVQKEDLVEIHKLFVETIQEVCIKDYDSSQINAWTSSINNKERWLKKVANQYFIVAQIENVIVGYASLECDNYFDFLYIHKNFQRKGIAKVLLDNIEMRAVEKNTDVITSDVSITARPFFERNGYIVRKTNTNVIDGVEIINYQMTKQL